MLTRVYMLCNLELEFKIATMYGQQMKKYCCLFLTWFVVFTSFATLVEENVDIENNFLMPPDDDSWSTRKISFGETIRFDELGPIIINHDGSARRITNWDILTDAEKETTIRVISRRNKVRATKLANAQKSEVDT